MSRYLVKFSKQGGIRFISHLDLLRVFQRAFRRSGLQLSYSSGFNPHPKIGFATPLSLGFESTGEYVEIETDVDYENEEVVQLLKANMPPGLDVLVCTKLKETSKTAAAAALRYARYTAEYRGGEDLFRILAEALPRFLEQEQIMSTKYSKKKRKDIETNIRPNIHSLNIAEDEEKEIFRMMLGAGNTGSLNPQILLKEFCSFCGKEYEESDWLYIRKEMYVLDRKNNIQPMHVFKG